MPASSDDQSIYDQIGGAPALKLVVSDFYRRVLADDELTSTFDNVDMERLERRQVEFFTGALGGPEPYSGPSMKDVHRHLAITAVQFGLVAQHLTDSLLAAQVPQATTDDIIEAIAGLADDIVTAE